MATCELDCGTKSILPRNVTIAYGVVYGLLLTGVSAYSFYFLMQYNQTFIKSSAYKKIKMWGGDVLKRRGCYIPLIAHIFDQITDISVAIQFYLLAIDEDKYKDEWCKCNGLNIWYLFALTILAMVIYRTISAYLIFTSTKSLLRLLFQLLDFELLRTLYINYLCNKTEPCDPQRYITALEAALESTPQALIQMIFLVKTNTLVLVSLLASFFSITSKLTSDDKVIVVEKVKRANFKFTWMSLLYVLRVFWRILDVSSRILLMTLIWIVIGGTALGIIICVEGLSFLTLCIISKQWQLLFGLVAMVISTTTPNLTTISVMIDVYRNISNVIIMIMISVWLFVDFECWRCTEYIDRSDLAKEPIIFGLFIYTWIAIILSPICLILLLFNDVFESEVSTSRNLKEMIISKNYDGILEMNLYAGEYGIYDKSNQKTLLMLAMQMHRTAIVTYLLNKTNDYKNVDKDGNNILDYYGDLSNDILTDITSTKPMCENLVKICKKHPDLVDSKERNAVLCGFAYKETTMYKVVEKIESSILLCRGKDKQNFIDYLDDKQLRQIDAVKFYEEKPDLVALEGTSPFFAECKMGNKTKVETLLTLYPDLINRKDQNGKNILDVYFSDKYLLSNKMLMNIYDERPDLVDSRNGRNLLLIAIFHKNQEIVNELIKIDPDIVLFTDRDNKNIYDYMWDNDDIVHIDFDCFAFYEKHPDLIKTDFASPFFHECVMGNAENVEKLLELYPDLLDRKDNQNNPQNLLDFYGKNSNGLTNKVLTSIYEQYPEMTDKNGGNIFLCCVNAQNYTIINMLIEKDQNIISSTSNNGNLLDYYVVDNTIFGNDLLQRLYEINPEITDKNGSNIFLCCVNAQNYEIINMLMEKDQNIISSTSNNGNLLDYYVVDKTIFGNDLLKRLYEFNPEMTDKNGSNIFWRCVNAKNYEIINMIMEKDQNIILSTPNNGNVLDYYVVDKTIFDNDGLKRIYQINPDLENKNGCNMYLCCVIVKNKEMCEWLKEKDPDIVHSTDSKSHGMVHYLFSDPQHDIDYHKSNILNAFEFYKTNPQCSTQNGKSPFFEACNIDDRKTVEELIISYPDLINTKDEDGKTLLDYYYNNKNLFNNTILTKIYQSNTNLVDLNGRNMFLVAFSSGNKQIVQKIINDKFDLVMSHAKNGETFLDYYQHNQLLDITTLMKIYSSYPFLTSQDGRDIISICAPEGNEEFVQNALDCVKLQHQYARNLLDHCISKIQLATTSVLVGINDKNSKLKSSVCYLSPFLIACYHDNLECVKKLMNRPMPNDVNWCGFNGATIAKLNGSNNVVNYLGSLSIYPQVSEQTKQTKQTNDDNYIIGKGQNKYDKKVNKEDMNIRKLLILGSSRSGKSTLFKQLRVLYGTGFMDKDRMGFKDHIYSQIIEQAKLLSEFYEELKEEFPEEYGHLQLTEKGEKAAQFIHDIPRNNVVDQTVAENIEIFWKEYAIKEISKVRSQFTFDDSTSYFFDNVRRIATKSYIPTDQDILLLRYRTTGVVEQKFSIHQHNYHIFDVGGTKSERKKWIHCFEDVTVVIFTASLSCYDTVMFEDYSRNMMMDSITLFEEICNLDWFVQSDMILFLTKKDLFASKIHTVPLTVCFEDYEGDTKSLSETISYIINRYKAMNKNSKEKQVYSHCICLTDKDEIERLFFDISSMILAMNKEQAGLI